MKIPEISIFCTILILCIGCQTATPEEVKTPTTNGSKKGPLLPDTNLNLKDRWEVYFREYLIEHPEADLNKDGILISKEFSVYKAKLKRKADLEKMGEKVKFISDIRYAESANPAHVLDFYLPSVINDPVPLVVFIHGGGWKGSSKDHSLLSWLTQYNYAVANIEFSSTNDHPFPQNIYDCKGAIRWLKANAAEYGYDANKIVVSGLSSGGHLAALIGTTGDVKALEGTVGGNLEFSSNVAGVMDLSGVIDMLKWAKNPKTLRTILGLSGTNEPVERLNKLYKPTTHLTKDDPPILLVHGALDHIVPIEHSELFHEACKEIGVPSELVVIEQLAHGHRYVTKEEQMPIVSFLKQYIDN